MAKETGAQVVRPVSKNAPRGYYSRRHKNSQPHADATARYKKHRGPAARRERARTRAAARAQRSTSEQLALLDQRPGYSDRERARLTPKKSKAA